MNEFVKVLSKPRFNQLMKIKGITDKNINKKFNNYAIISINDTSGKWFMTWFKFDHDNVLRLWFDDVLRDGETISKYNRKGIKIKDEQIKKIINFIIKNKNKKIIVHCTAGISRSGAIALFITKILGYDLDLFYKKNIRVKPNKIIYYKLNKIYKECIQFQ